MAEPRRVVILGGGFGGSAVARRLEQLFRRDARVEITLVDRENFSLFTPLLPEVPSGALEPKHIVSPLRARLRRTVVRQAEVRAVDLSRRIVLASHCPTCQVIVLPFDHLVLAVGSATNFFGLPKLGLRMEGPWRSYRNRSSEGQSNVPGTSRWSGP
jgi:NADH dehydrogenase